ncbi:pilus assembly protein TadG-related protein [Streptomyces sp. NBC_01198]|uniref:pilus assembly protein TadG-related protein n=1 Tax=Streptomyces sp. NBC_01198 TaxID=2903769 RepID=UPI002E140871|nr:pilus assembly protein TadG-related protein [Streptomyces sp. NBC_01198]
MVIRGADDAGQTLGLYIVAIAALFFLAFAFFAVGQASVDRNSVQSAADAAALAAARESRDEAHDALLAALTSGDTAKLGDLVQLLGKDTGEPCMKARAFAGDNGARAYNCVRNGGPGAYTVDVESLTTLGRTVVHGTENVRAEAHASAEVTSRCDGLETEGSLLTFTCDGGKVTVDPTSADFTLDLSAFYAVHLTS